MAHSVVNFFPSTGSDMHDTFYPSCNFITLGLEFKYSFSFSPKKIVQFKFYKINEFIFVIIESKHIYYSIGITHKITGVLLRIIHLKTLIPDLLNWLYYSEQILPFSQVNYFSQCRVKKLSCSEYPHPSTPTFSSKG